LIDAALFEIRLPAPYLSLEQFYLGGQALLYRRMSGTTG
jgi:hypothetical protein